MEWMKILLVAFAALGWIQWAKKFTPDLPTWVWGVALPPLCLGMGAVMFLTPMYVQVAVMGVALAQIGYEVLVQAVKKLAGL